MFSEEEKCLFSSSKQTRLIQNLHTLGKTLGKTLGSFGERR